MHVLGGHASVRRSEPSTPRALRSHRRRACARPLAMLPQGVAGQGELLASPCSRGSLFPPTLPAPACLPRAHSPPLPLPPLTPHTAELYVTPYPLRPRPRLLTPPPPPLPLAGQGGAAAGRAPTGWRRGDAARGRAGRRLPGGELPCAGRGAASEAAGGRRRGGRGRRGGVRRRGALARQRLHHRDEGARHCWCRLRLAEGCRGQARRSRRGSSSWVGSRPQGGESLGCSNRWGFFSA